MNALKGFTIAAIIVGVLNLGLYVSANTYPLDEVRKDTVAFENCIVLEIGGSVYVFCL